MLVNPDRGLTQKVVCDFAAPDGMDGYKMKTYQPLVLQKLDIRVPGNHIRQIALHRHLPETTDVQPHRHPFTQCLLYLSGQGRQIIGNGSSPIRTGAAVLLPPGVEHAFHREANRRPICLVIDFKQRGASIKHPAVAYVPLTVLHEVGQLLAAISRLERQSGGGYSLQLCALVLNLLDLCLSSLGLLEPRKRIAASPICRKVEKLLSLPGSATLPPGELARRAGYHRDYLNRQLKKDCGLTLGQLRSELLVKRAQQFLQAMKTIAEVSTALGFDDPNYFSRWFRKQTGLTPNLWRRESEQHRTPAAKRNN